MAAKRFGTGGVRLQSFVRAVDGEPKRCSMGKVFGVLLIVGLVWVGLELYTEGPARAFGGAFAFLAPADAPEAESLSTPQRARAAVVRAHEQSEERRERLLRE